MSKKIIRAERTCDCESRIQQCIHQSTEQILSKYPQIEETILLNINLVGKHNETDFEVYINRFLMHVTSATKHTKVHFFRTSYDQETAAIIRCMLSARQTFDILSPSIDLKRSTVIALTELIEQSELLLCLDLRDVTISKAKATNFVDALCKNKSIQTLIFPRLAIGVRELVGLVSKLFTTNKTIKYISFGTFPLDRHEGSLISELSNALAQNTSLKGLKFSSVEINHGVVCAVVESLKHNSHLETLIIKKNTFWSKCFSNLSTAFETNESLLKLDLSSNTLNVVTIDAISSFVSKSYGVMSILNLYGCSLTDDNIITICAAFETNETIWKLDLSYNWFKLAGAIAIANMLKKNNTLVKLNLSSNGLTNEGVLAIATAVNQNTTLKKLNLASTIFMFDSAYSRIFELLASQSSPLSHLDLSCIIIDDESLAVMHRTMLYNETIVELECRSRYPILIEIQQVAERNAHNAKQKEQTLFASLFEKITQPTLFQIDNHLQKKILLV